MRRILFCGTALLTCVSCNVGPDYVRPELYNEATIAQELHLKENRPLPQKWYCRLGDSQLTEFVEKGLQNNTDIQTAIARLHQARTTLRINAADYLPQIGAKGGYNYDKYSKNIGVAADSHYYSAGFDASWELDLWGKGRRQTEADEASVRAAEYTLQDVRNVVAAEIAADYVSLLQNKENLHFAERNARLQQDIFATVSAKYQSGLSDETSYREAQYLLENTRAQIPQYRAAIEQYKNALATVIGVLPAELNTENVSEKSLLQFSIKADLFDFPLYVVRLRPDVAAAEQKLAAQNALVGAAVAELYPDVSISGLWGYAAQGGSKLIRSDSQTYNYAPLLTLPLLDWNRLQNNVKLQEYMRQETLDNYKQAVLNAVAEIRNAQTAYETSKISARNKYAAWRNMQTAAELTQKKYESGLAEFADVMRTQQNLVTAQRDYVAAMAQNIQNLIAFYKAIGAPV